MKENEDLRVYKTHLALKKAFFELSAEKPFDKITINSLCDKALIRRSTFYRHFEDKYDFFGYLLKSLLEEFNEKNNDKYDTIQPESYYTAVIYDILSFLQRHQRLIESLLTSDYYHTIKNIFYAQIYDTMCKQFQKEKNNGYQFSVPEELLAQFFTGGIVRVIFIWLHSGQKQSIDELTNDINHMLKQFWNKVPYQEDYKNNP